MYYNTLPLSSLLDSVFRSKMKSKAELRIMLYFFFMLHSLFVILSFSPPILFTKKNLQQKEQFFESCSTVVAALRSSANATADELLVCTPFLCMAHFQLWHSFITRIFHDSTVYNFTNFTLTSDEFKYIPKTFYMPKPRRRPKL